MNKVYIEGYEVGFSVDAIGNREKKIQVASGEIVSIDENFIYKSIETEKVKVQQFVADFIAKQKKLGHTLSYSIDASMSDIVAEWYWDNSELFAQAWIFGYEVEEEKKFFVKIKCLSEEYKYLNYFKSRREWLFSEKEETKEYRTAHTRKELEYANFGWVFSCEGIEIEEVVG